MESPLRAVLHGYGHSLLYLAVLRVVVEFISGRAGVAEVTARWAATARAISRNPPGSREINEANTSQIGCDMYIVG